MPTRSFLRLAAVCLFSGLVASVPHSAASQTVASADLQALASEGRFDELLEAVKSQPDTQNPRAAALAAGLERYQSNEQVRQRRRADAYEQAFDNIGQEIETGDLEQALIAAINAHSIAEEPLLVLRDPQVTNLVKKTEIAAKQAELDEDWVEAAVLFGRLNLLYEEDSRYREDLKRVNAYLRVIALYSPQVLRELQEARAIRVGKAEDIDQPRTDAENWQERLKGIDAEMLRRSLSTAAKEHIDHEGFNQMLIGSIERLLTVLDTPVLTEVFPGLKDLTQTAVFREDLLRMKAELAEPDRELSRNRAMSLIDEVMAKNQRTVGLPENVVAYEMTEGALGTLDDFSSMYWPEDIDYLSRSTQGEFPGIGVSIARRLQTEPTTKNGNGELEAGGEDVKPVVNAFITVISPLAGSPAIKAGLKAGDLIVTVDGEDARNWSLNRAVKEITGPVGTTVALGILREGEDEPLEFKVERGRIPIESVKGWAHTDDGGWNFWIDKPAGIGYVRLTQFIPQSLSKLDAAVAELQADGQLNSLVLDLRHNPGGLLTSAIQIVNRFLDSGPILYTVDGERLVQSAWNAQRRGTYPDFEVVILINRGSASASEIVSGALQDRGRAFVIGDRSYGKGSVQDVVWVPFPPPRAKYGLKITTHYYQLPNGRIIHRQDDSEVWGIDPDLEIDVTNQTVAWNLELRQAIDVLRDADAETIEVELSKPWVKLAGIDPVDVDADNAEETVDVPLPQPADLLKLGLDPQLEAALLVLKTSQVTGNTAVAEKP
ncbi:MAG: S41 family peptidase [Planctomycetota bacterium]